MAMRDAGGRFTSAKSQMIAELRARLRIDTNEFRTQMEESRIRLEKFAKGITKTEQQVAKAGPKMGSSFSSLLASMGKLAGSVAGGVLLADAFKRVASAAIDAAKAGVQLAASYEQSQIAFRVMIGEVDRADRFLADLKSFADATPFRFTELVATAKQLRAFGVETEKVEPALRRIGDVASGTGNKIGELAFVYGQTRAAGRLMTRDLLQFTDRGVPLIDQLTDQLDISREKLRTLTEEGKIPFEVVEEAFRRMADEGGKFAGLTELQSQSAAGLMSTLRDAVENVMRAFGEGLLGVQSGTSDIKDIMKEIIARLKEWEPGARKFGTAVQGWIGGFRKLYDILVDIANHPVTKTLFFFPGKAAEGFSKLFSFATGGDVKSGENADVRAKNDAAFAELIKARDAERGRLAEIEDERKNTLRREREAAEEARIAAEKEAAKQAEADAKVREAGMKSYETFLNGVQAQRSQLQSQLIGSLGPNATDEQKKAAAKARAQSGFDTRARDLNSRMDRALDALNKSFKGLEDDMMAMRERATMEEAILEEFRMLNKTSEEILKADIKAADAVKAQEEKINKIQGLSTGSSLGVQLGAGIRRAAGGISTDTLLAKANAQRTRMITLLEKIASGGGASLAVS